MAADDDKNEAPDPWADLVADDLDGGGQDQGGEEMSFSFVDEAQPSAEPNPDADAALDAFVAESFESQSLDEPLLDTPLAADVTDGPTDETTAVNDDDVGAWLTAMDGESADANAASAADADVTDAAPPLSVFAPDELVAEQASQSAIEIGTGFSGIDMSAGDGGSQAETATEGLEGWGGLDDSESPAASDETDAFAAVADDAEAGFGIDADDTDATETEEPTLSFEAAVPAMATAAAATAVAKPRAAAAKPRAKGGGLGPMIGVVAGGVMAIPITMAILIWGFQRDPFGIAKQVPESMAFLLPQKFQPGFKKRAAASPDASAAPSLDDLAAATPAPDASSTDASEPAADAAPQGDEPPSEPGIEPALPDAALAAVDPLAPATDAAPKPDAPASEPSDPLFPDPDAPAPATPDPLATDVTPAASPAPVAAVESAPPALPPLDTAALETAVAEAAAAIEAAAAVEDHSDIAGKKLLVGWYKSLARTADELVKLENEAADTGRPLEGTHERLAELHAGIAAQDAVAATLPKLARDWLAYARRDSEGILLPVTFDSAKKVGPYWRSKVQLDEGDDARELAIITREEPAAVAGDKLLVTGIVFDGDVIWAADVRSPTAEPATVDF
jgi:hypothetical protein